MSRCAPRVPAAAALVRELLAHLVPDLLGVDEHAVEVEDDGVDHSGWYRGRGRRATPRAGPCSSRCTSPTKSVWSPVAHLGRRFARASQPTRAGEQARVVVAHRDPVPERDRRNAAREVLGERVLVAGEDRDRPLARPRAAPRRARPDGRARCRRAAGRARARRARDRQPGTAAAGLGDDDRDARGPAAKQRSLLVRRGRPRSSL